MPDVFDELAAAPKGDVFDELAASPASGVDQNAQLRQGTPDTFGSRLGRAYDAFQSKIRPHDVSAAFDPFRLVGALDAASAELAPSAREALSPLIGPTDAQKAFQDANPNPDRSKIDTQGLIPGAVESLSRIAPIASAAESFKSEPNPDDSLGLATAKAAKNVALDIGTSIASPLGALLTETGAVAPKATAAALTPLVMKSIGEAAKAHADNEPEQKQIEKILMSLVGVTGTAAALHEASVPTAPATTTPRVPSAAGIAGEAVDAAKYLKNELGVDIPLTAGEATGNAPTIVREAFIKRFGGFSGSGGNTPLPYQIQQAIADDLVQGKVRESAAEAGTKSDVGATVANEISIGEQALREDTNKAIGKAAAALPSEADKALGPLANAQEATPLGQRIRDVGTATHEFNRSVADTMFDNAEQIRQSKGGPAEFIQPNEVRKVAQDIRNNSASQGGVPIEKLAPGQGLISDILNWTDPQTIGQFNHTISTIGESLNKRQAGVQDDFGAGFATGNLKRIYGALVSDRDNALNALGPDVKAAYDPARAFYKKNIEDFQKSPINAKILNEADMGGFANTADIVSHFAGGDGKLNDLLAIKTFLPSGDYDALKAGIIDSLRSQNTIPTASGHVEDLTGFAKSFRELAPEFKRELLGSDKAVNQLQGVLDEFGPIKKATEVLGQRQVASPEAMQALIDGVRSGNTKAAKQAFGEALSKDSARSRDYFNDITKDIRAGSLGKVPVDPARFVDDFLLKSDDVNTVKNALQQLTPKTRENVRRMVLQKFFELAADSENSTVKQLLANEPNISGRKLIDLFVTDPKRREIVQALIPENHRELITNLIKYKRGIEYARKIAGNTGMMGNQAQFSGGRGGGFFSFIPRIAESFPRATLMRYVARAYFTEPVQAVVQRAIADDSFLTTAVAAQGLAAAKAGAQKVGSMVPQSVKNAASTAKSIVPTLTRDDLIQLSGQFGATKVRQYLDTKDKLDKDIENLSPDQLKALFIVAPEVVSPLNIEGTTPAR